MKTMRKFHTGATRDTDKDKLDFESFFAPSVLEGFANYMQKHSIQSDGNIRPGDNWQKLFGSEHYSVCMKSAWRHFFDLWKEHRGLKSRDGIEDAICGVLFNVMAYYYKFLNEKKKPKKQKTKELI